MWNGEHETCLLFVIGPKGIGKTTLVKSLVQTTGDWVAKNTIPYVPFIQRGAVVVLGRFHDYHEAMQQRSRKSKCNAPGPASDGADRVRGEALCRNALPHFVGDGVKLIVCESIKANVCCLATKQAAAALDMKVMMVELHEPNYDLGQTPVLLQYVPREERKLHPNSKPNRDWKACMEWRDDWPKSVKTWSHDFAFMWLQCRFAKYCNPANFSPTTPQLIYDARNPYSDEEEEEVKEEEEEEEVAAPPWVPPAWVAAGPRVPLDLSLSTEEDSETEEEVQQQEEEEQQQPEEEEEQQPEAEKTPAGSDTEEEVIVVEEVSTDEEDKDEEKEVVKFTPPPKRRRSARLAAIHQPGSADTWGSELDAHGVRWFMLAEGVPH